MTIFPYWDDADRIEEVPPELDCDEVRDELLQTAQHLLADALSARAEKCAEANMTLREPIALYLAA